jgi:hypothetical protein
MSDQYSTPGSQSLAPFVGKRSRNVDESAETATSNDDWEDAGRQKRAKTPEVSGFGVYDCAENFTGLVDSDYLLWPAFGAQALSCDGGSSGTADPFERQFWGSMSGGVQADSFGFPSSYGMDQNNRWAGPSIPGIQDATASLPGFLPTLPAPEPDFYGPDGLGYAVSSTQGQDAFQTMYTGLAHGQGGGGLMGPNLIVPHLASDLAQDGIKPLGLSDDPAPMILEPMARDPVVNDEPVAAPSPPRLETTVPSESPRAEDAEYDTCFGVVGNPPDTWFFL